MLTRITQRVVLIAIAVPLLMATAASASAPPPPPTYSPQSGPPGTVVNVSGISLCDNSQPPATSGQIGLATLDQKAVGSPMPFTPPKASFTIPNAPNGDYWLYLLCAGGAEGMSFTITGSTVVPEPVGAMPTFTG